MEHRILSAMTLAELQRIYTIPFFDLLERARSTFSSRWNKSEVQLCTLLSIKTGGCSEDCGYCAQSARYQTGVRAERLMDPQDVLEVARRAWENGSTRFCMGAAWKGVRDGEARFEQVLEIVRAVSQLGMEVCVTLGQLSLSAAKKLKEAGVTAYNHNIDTSEEYYPQIVSTHRYSDRLDTIRAVQQADISVCCGGIVGMGETEFDRLKMLEVLTNFDPQLFDKTKAFKIDPAKSPKQLDLQREKDGKVKTLYQGIYKIEGDTLTFCRSALPVGTSLGERPTEFKAGAGVVLLQFKRSGK